MATVTVGIPDPATCTINPDAGGGGGGANKVPIADITSAFNLVQQPNPVLGSGDITVLAYPADTVAIAFQLDGDDFPRILILSDGTDGIYLGNGTFDPYLDARAGINYSSGGGGSLGLFSAAALQLEAGVNTSNPGTYSVANIGSAAIGGVLSVPVIATDPVTAASMIVNQYAIDDVALAIQLEGDAFPRWLLLSDATNGLYLGDGTTDPYNGDTGGLIYAGGGDGAPGLSLRAFGTGSNIRLTASDGQISLEGAVLVTGDLSFDGGSTINLNGAGSINGDAGLNINATTDIQLVAGAAIDLDSETGITFQCSAGAYIFTNLPSTDPGVAGQLYTGALGALFVSAG